ncbi:MAG TPA: ABC transporter ATP-binding protein [Rhizomicrobium sp.]|nr:ABC transporter ATP-binding protein [Rhizomicrobium sp.]
MSAAVAFERISARYGTRLVLNEVRARFAKGAVTGIVGPNGAGKTTLFRAALGLLPSFGGMITVLDKPLSDWSREGLARTTAYLPQGSDAHWPIRARQLVSLGRLPHRGPFASLSGVDAIAIDEALVRCDARQFGERRMDELSAGERARVLFARALATAAPILLADEPAAYLDPAHQLRLMELLREEASRGTAVAVTLHDLALASRHCDEIIVLDRGRVAGQGAPEVALSDAALARVFGISAMHTRDPAGGRGALTPWQRL